MTKLVKAIRDPSTSPDCWKAQGSDTIADPTMAFHILKTITKESSPLSTYILRSVLQKIGLPYLLNGKWITNSYGSITCFGGLKKSISFPNSLLHMLAT